MSVSRNHLLELAQLSHSHTHTMTPPTCSPTRSPTHPPYRTISQPGRRSAPASVDRDGEDESYAVDSQMIAAPRTQSSLSHQRCVRSLDVHTCSPASTVTSALQHIRRTCERASHCLVLLSSTQQHLVTPLVTALLFPPLANRSASCCHLITPLVTAPPFPPRAHRSMSASSFPVQNFHGDSTPMMGTPHHGLGSHVVQPLARESTPRDALAGVAAAAARGRLNMSNVSQFDRSAASSPMVGSSPLMAMSSARSSTATGRQGDPGAAASATSSSSSSSAAAATSATAAGRPPPYHSWRPQSAFGLLGNASPLPHVESDPSLGPMLKPRMRDTAAVMSPSHAAYYTSPLREQGMSPRTIAAADVSTNVATTGQDELSTPGREKSSQQ